MLNKKKLKERPFQGAIVFFCYIFLIRFFLYETDDLGLLSKKIFQLRQHTKKTSAKRNIFGGIIGLKRDAKELKNHLAH